MPKKIPIATNAAPTALGTSYTQAIRSGDFVFLNAQIGLNPKTGKLEEGLEAQTRQMLANVDAVLNAAGCTRRDIVKVTLLMTDLQDFLAIDQIYAAWLPDRGESPLPVRTAFAAILPEEILVMLDVIAAFPH